MKKYISILCLLVCFSSTCIFYSASSTTEDALHKTSETYDLLNFPAVPHCIALNSKHYVAILFQDNFSRKITLIKPNGEQSTFSFNTSGSSLIELTEDKIVLYLLRSDFRKIYDFEGRLIRSDKFHLEHKVYNMLREQTELQCGNAILSVKKSWKKYELFLDGKQILHCNLNALIISKGPFLPFIFVPFIFLALIVKIAKGKKSSC